MKRSTAFSVCLLVLFIGVEAYGSPETVIELVPGYDVTTWPPAPFRWKDVAPYLYSDTYRATYSYDSATVMVSFAPGADTTFSGSLWATNLKPHFAYQMKLVGKPESLWGSAGDDVTNELIGYTGRWWRSQPTSGNSNDAEYEAYHDNPDYVFEGYLLFDFFTTDASGNAELTFLIDSSFHVLWWEHQRDPQACDSPTKWTTVVADASNPAYERNVGPTTVGVYAQIERLCYGESRLGDGNYNCRFLLTEETFHQSGENEGYWASAMVCDTVYFDIGDPSHTGEPTGLPSLTLLPMQPNPWREHSFVELMIPAPALVSLTIYDSSGRVVSVPSSAVLARGNHRLGWDGRDAAGRPVSAGVYFYRVDVPGLTVGRGRVSVVR
ncbi:MAG: hypothetical protein KAY32_13670 [Candidatus Eisenbacteria sp.]|nr:hypothetical protein [Candidatus Eisenbacteria bacterium]